jgi:hypothetical protein
VRAPCRPTNCAPAAVAAAGLSLPDPDRIAWLNPRAISYFGFN